MTTKKEMLLFVVSAATAAVQAAAVAVSASASDVDDFTAAGGLSEEQNKHATATATAIPSPPTGFVADEPEWFKYVPWLICYIVFSLCIEMFELGLNLRQLRRYRIVAVPPELRNTIDENEVKKNNNYGADKMKFSIVSSAFTTIVWFFTTTFFLGPFFWRMAGKCVEGANEYLQSLIFLGFSFVFSEVLAIPFSLYFDFVVEERHGFNKKTLALFVYDRCMSTVVTAVIGAPTICCIIWLVKLGGPNFYLWLEGFMIVMVFVMMFVYPNFIAPLFNKFETLKDTALREKIETLAASLKFPLAHLYQIDGSKRSSHSNAYFYGLWWSKRIVLYDTLLHLPHNRILAILGHELGHWKMGHTRTMMCFSFAHTFVIFFLYGKVMSSPSLFNSFGYHDTRATIVGLMLFYNIFSPVNTLLGFGMTLLSRKNEFEADEFSSSLGYNKDLQDALVDIHKENRSTLDPDPLYSWWNYSHPPLLERLRALERLAVDEQAKQKKQT